MSHDGGIIFYLENGDEVELYYGHEINSDDGYIEDMKIEHINKRPIGAGRTRKVRKVRKSKKKSKRSLKHKKNKILYNKKLYNID